MIKKTLPLLLLSMIFSGCATNPNKIQSNYVSPLKYQDYDCEQIAMELDYVTQRTNELYSNLKKEANADAWQTGVGLAVFWPSLLFLEGGDGPQAAEYARLKGEYDALRKAAIQKKCNIDPPPSPEEIIKRKDGKGN